MNTSIDAPPLSTGGRQGDRPTIAILSPLIVGSYLSEVIAGIAAAADDAGVRLIALQTLDLTSVGGEPPASQTMQFGGVRTYVGWPAGSENKVPHFGLRAAWDRVTGFIVVLNAVEPWYLRALRRAGKRVVVVSDEPEGASCPVVHTDNRTGIMEAVSHLVEHGHRRIGFAGSLDQLDIRQRRDAYVEALGVHGLAADPSLLFPATDNLVSGGVSAGGRMLEAGMPSTAVVAATDYNALGIMQALREAGLSLPRDQAITGFDDIQAAEEATPALSTVRQSAQLTGHTAADLLFAMLRGRRVGRGPHLVPARFVARESCGCPSASASDPLGVEDPLRGASPRERLRVHLQRRLLGRDAPTPPQASALDGAADLIVRSIAPEAGDAESDSLPEAAQLLLAVSPHWTTITETMGCLLQLRRDLGSALGEPRNLGRFERGVLGLGAELGRTLQALELRSRAALNRAVGQEHQLSMSLITGSEGDPRSLGWLGYTRARAGCLGLWSTPGERGGAEGSLLDMAGTYRRDGGRLAVPDQVRVEDFPPDDLFEGVEWPPGHMAVVMPVATRSADLGLLAVVTSTDTSVMTVHDRLFEQGALLSVVIERVLMTERLRRSNNDLATFSHAMAHDLRNPLATISMWTSVARAEVRPGDPADAVLQIVDRISEVTRYASDLVVDLLDYSTLDREAGPMEPVDLALAARQALMTQAATVAAQGAIVEVGELPTVRGRPAELEMVFQNLIENAIKYRGARSPRIRLSAARAGGSWKIRCHDNGDGVPANIRAEVFEPFVRGDSASPGSGIGLATCRRIVEAHGGLISVEATGRSGTTIAFTLPALRGPGPAAGGGPGAAPAPATVPGADPPPAASRRRGRAGPDPVRRR